MGYSDSFIFEVKSKTYYLPNTTLWHSKKNSNQAVHDLQGVCYSLGVSLEKAIAVLASEFNGI